MSYTVAIAGASGYAGGELIRLITNHPELELKTVTAFNNVGQSLASQHPHLAAAGNYTFTETTASELSGHEVVFLALPHGKSAQLAAQLLATPNPPKLLIDCGADHRLTSESDWTAFYSGAYSPAWSYGIPELPIAAADKVQSSNSAEPLKQRSKLVGASKIAAPGCNASAVSLALAPAVLHSLVETGDLSATLAVGPSGAGKSLRTDLLAAEILGSANPYAVGGTHRHIPEIAQNLRLAGADQVSLTFTPVIVPMSRGILAVSTAKLKAGVTLSQLREAYESVYNSEAFVQLLPDGVFPRSADVLGSNSVQLGLTVDKGTGRLTVVTALDNLTKGTAGAAVQSLNLALGIAETTALNRIGVAP